MAAKRKLARQPGPFGGNKRRPQPEILRPGVGGLPAKPVFSHNDVKVDRHKDVRHSSEATNIASTEAVNHNMTNTGSFEMFPGMMVDLPGESIPSNDVNSNPNTNNMPQPSAEALNLFSSILGTLQSSPQQRVQTQAQHQYVQPFPQQYRYPPQVNPNPYFASTQNQQPYAQNPVSQYQYPQNYSQPVYQNYSQLNQPALPAQPKFDGGNQQSNAFLSMFNQLLESYSPLSNQSMVDEPDVNANVKSQSQKNDRPMKPAKNDKAKQKKNKKPEQIETNGDNGLDDDLLADEEVELKKKIAVQGTNIILENEEDIQRWIEERKKNWPTNSRVEKKRKELENAKRIVENINHQTHPDEKDTPKVKMCNFWLRTKKCRLGKDCKFSHDMSNYSKPKNYSGKTRTKTLSTKPLPNHKLKLIHGIPVQIPSRFTPLKNEGKSLHNLLMEGERFQSENVELLGLFTKMVKSGIIKQDWNGLKKKLKLDDESLSSI
ncbi:hypothetical protein PMKS-000230 [Pichia membranifaciens]|uniref:C3H1-type domain-containing protein n=1 Tax=Pichia membranifaciens TaxID=4926 RepID=A0A1Q2YB62_9ASCO|nr:hypothetical protein PMKS-000230 [Pichia membranifaciens]